MMSLSGFFILPRKKSGKIEIRNPPSSPRPPKPICRHRRKNRTAKIPYAAKPYGNGKQLQQPDATGS